MEQPKVAKHLGRTIAVLLAAVTWLGCQQQQPARSSGQTAKAPSESPAAEGKLPQQATASDATASQEGLVGQTAAPAEGQPQPERRGVGQQQAESVAESATRPPSDSQQTEMETDQAEGAAEGATTPQPPGPPAETEPWETTPPEAPELGPPLVDNVAELKPLDPQRPVWIDTRQKRIVMLGQVCQTDAPLELFACLRDTKEHEAIVTVDVRAATVHAGLLALGASPGHPARWQPEYRPASGTEIEVAVVWKDEQGNRRTARAQDWILNVQTKQPMSHPWVFAGSGFWKDEQTGEEYYQAEGGDFICVANFTTAMLDLPIESSQANDALMFRAFTERIPPRGTPVTLLLSPKLEPQAESQPARKEC